MNTRGSSGQKQNMAGEVAADELCFSTPRMNTRSCLLAQKRKEGPGSRPVGPGEEEVTNDDDDYTSDREEEATIKFSFPDQKSVKKISDEELLVIIFEGIACLPLRGTASCDCLDILSDVNIREKEKVPEIKEELKRLELGAHGKKAELVASLEEHLSTEPSRAEPSRVMPSQIMVDCCLCGLTRTRGHDVS